MDLAKRLSEELAAQQQGNQTGSLKAHRAPSPDTEPRSRSFEQRSGHKAKGNFSKTKLLCFAESRGFRFLQKTILFILYEFNRFFSCIFSFFLA
jgi:hypothetical protein